MYINSFQNYVLEYPLESVNQIICPLKNIERLSLFEGVLWRLSDD